MLCLLVNNIRDLLNATLISFALYELAKKIPWFFTVTIFLTVVKLNVAARINLSDYNVKKNADRLAESDEKLSQSNTMKSLIEISFNANK